MILFYLVSSVKTNILECFKTEIPSLIRNRNNVRKKWSSWGTPDVIGRLSYKH